jgi:hypothetical protein
MKAHAEIAQVWPRDGRLRLVGRLHGHEPGPAEAAGWALELVVRDADEPRLRYPAPLAEGRFDASLPVGDLTPAGLPMPATWDIYLASGSARLRAGRLLDDISGKKKIMIFPAQPVRAAGRTVLVKPYYTINDYLAIECLPEKATATDGTAAAKDTAKTKVT